MAILSESEPTTPEAMALAKALHASKYPKEVHTRCQPSRDELRAVKFVLASPLLDSSLRKRIASEIESHYLGPDSGRTYDGKEPPDAHCRNAYDEGLQKAVEVVLAVVEPDSVTEPPGVLPHSKACGLGEHEHGPDCHPTCICTAGKAVTQWQDDHRKMDHP